MESMDYEFDVNETFSSYAMRKLGVKEELDCHTTLLAANMPIIPIQMKENNMDTNNNLHNNNNNNIYKSPSSSSKQSDKSQSPRITSSTEIFLVKRRPPPMTLRCVDSVSSPLTASVSKRNERERNRVKLVNMGFQTLRQHIPNGKSKLSKVQTLRSAVDYIRQLQSFLNEDL